jgi:hypothetical protein
MINDYNKSLKSFRKIDLDTPIDDMEESYDNPYRPKETHEPNVKPFIKMNQAIKKRDLIPTNKTTEDNFITDDKYTTTNIIENYSETNGPDKVILVYNKKTLAEKDNYDNLFKRIKHETVEEKPISSERKYLVKKPEDTLTNIMNTNYKVTDRSYIDRNNKSSSVISYRTRDQDEIDNSLLDNDISRHKNSSQKHSQKPNNKIITKAEIPVYKRTINIQHNPNSTRPEFVIAEKLFPLLEGTIVYKRNVFVKKINEDYKIVKNANFIKPEDFGFKEYFCYIDKQIAQITFNKIKNEDKTSEIYLTSLIRLGVPKVTKNLIFIKQMYKKIKEKNIKESLINKYISQNSEKLIKLYNKGMKQNEINLDECIYNEQYRHTLLNANLYLLYVYLKEDIRLEIIFKEYDDFKYWINGLEDLINKKEDNVLKLIRQKII